MSGVGVGREARGPGWTFLTNHSHVLICIAEDRWARPSDIAAWVDITEPEVQRILKELCDAGYVTKVRQGWRNCYEVHADRRLRHTVEGHCMVSELLETIRGLHVSE